MLIYISPPLSCHFLPSLVIFCSLRFFLPLPGFLSGRNQRCKCTAGFSHASFCTGLHSTPSIRLCENAHAGRKGGRSEEEEKEKSIVLISFSSSSSYLSAGPFFTPAMTSGIRSQSSGLPSFFHGCLFSYPCLGASMPHGTRITNSGQQARAVTLP